MATTQTSQPQHWFSPLDLLTRRLRVAVEPTPLAAATAVERGPAAVRTYAFATVDYPGAAWSFLADTNGTTAVGYFFMDPHSSSVATAFTFKGGVLLTRVRNEDTAPGTFTGHVTGGTGAFNGATGTVSGTAVDEETTLLTIVYTR